MGRKDNNSGGKVALSRKHYTALAKALKDAKPENRNFLEAMVCWEQVVRNVAAELKSDNYGFNKDRFYEACGMEVK